MLSSYFFSKPWQLVQDKMQLYICENIDNCKWYKFFCNVWYNFYLCKSSIDWNDAYKH